MEGCGKETQQRGTQRPFASDHHDRKTVTVRCKSMLDFDYIGVRPTGVVLVDQDRTGHKIHGVPVVSNLADAGE